MSDEALSKEVMHDVDRRYESGTPYSSGDFEGMTDQEHRLVLHHSAMLQRVHPEYAMNAIQRKLQGGAYQHIVEHVGDLYHRSQESPVGSNFGMGYVREKLNKTIPHLNGGYGFERKMRESLKANSDYLKDPSINWDTAVVLGKDYAKEHSRLPVYNYPALLMNQAAQHLGNMRFGAATAALEQLHPHVHVEDEPYEALQYPDDPETPAKVEKWKEHVEGVYVKWRGLHTRQASIDFLKRIGR